MNSTVGSGEHFLLPLLHLDSDLLCIGSPPLEQQSKLLFPSSNSLKWLFLFLLCLLAHLILKGVVLFIKSFSQILLRTLTISVQLTGGISKNCTNDDELYHSLLKWLGKHCTDSLHTRKISTKTISSKADDEYDPEADSEDENHRPSPDYDWAYHLSHTLGYGVNYINYKRKWIRVNRHMLTPTADVNKVSQEMVSLTVFIWNKDFLQGILEAAKPHPKKVDSDNHTIIYKAHAEGYWSRLGGPKKKRPLNSLILESQVVQGLVSDVQNFLTMEDWYIERGIPYRRGYLLHGPPGCGKSSVIKAIAGELNYNICVFSLSQKLTDDGLTELFNVAPERSIILLEDIDAAFKSREHEGSSAKETNLAFEGCSPSALTFMGLLNSLDGVASADDGQLVFMTTNYPERLDPALIRPGRVDLKISIDYPNDVQIVGMFKKFFPFEANNEELVKSFVNKIRSLKISMSMAMLQGLLLVYRDSPTQAISKAEEYFKEQFSNANLAKEKISALYC